ncbi:4Fe-4S dicluster domain-containing protein [Nocardioides mangrovicus]|uniref:ferredoxin--NADP(+) reductase n=1 Tax=Nocardioides mangrovicus TaxID=2478913 RepID=A0A3L8NWE8_9ACTN|nr:FAD-dependent oxidoreductase [Nocardioides mangrovicus]RLV47470.1 4Fe-4S dicluster domain-containing protein [Nocardioides mangrovicus]
MTHVITQNCCNDAACVPVCPVNCIHPTPDEPDYATAEMLYIDPQGCIDCGACLDVCPVGAIAPDFDLPDRFVPYLDLNAGYYEDPVRASYAQNPKRTRRRRWEADATRSLKVAIVGSGPAACYAAEELLAQRHLGAQVDMFERLPVPGGLVRYGVAPDHQATKSVTDTFARTMRRQGFRLFLNVEVGTHLTHEDLMGRYHAVVYAVGAMSDRPLDIPGEDLAGSHSATEFVAWYNGHPDFADRSFDLSGERAVVFGNGNVALDVARVLVSDIDRLRRTDIADHALEQLAASAVREVVVAGRRGPAQAAFTTPELLGLVDLADVDLVVRRDELVVEHPQDDGDRFVMGPRKTELLRRLGTEEPARERRVTMRFLASPGEILGSERVEGVRLLHNELVEQDGSPIARPTGAYEDLSCGLVLRSVGYRGKNVGGLPFDDTRAILPNDHGRVLESALGAVLPGVFVTGWIKRGPSGVIGTNKKCAKETVGALLDDFVEGRLPTPRLSDDLVDALPEHLDLQGWRAIDRAEVQAGEASGRPRVKLTRVDDMLRTAHGGLVAAGAGSEER